MDPRMSTAASQADLWLPVKPGSDLAVILAWIHLIVVDAAWDASFVDNHCVGLEELKAHVANTTPAWAAQEAGVPEESIRQAYTFMREAMPSVVIHPGRHVSWYGEADTQRARGMAILTALLGAWWTPGGTYRPESPVLGDLPGPDFPTFPYDVDAASQRFPFKQEVTTNGIRDATRTGKPYPVKGWFVHATNLVQSIPHAEETLEAIRTLDMLVVCDVLPTEITRWADVLLPEDTYLERYDDILTGSGREPFVGLRQPVVASPYDTRPAWRIAKELAAELGVGAYLDFATMEDYLGARLAGTGVTLEDLRRDGVRTLPRKTALFLAPGTDHHFHTPSGKVELFSQQLKDAGFDPLPAYRPQPEPPAGTLRLLYGRSPVHTFGRTQNNPILADVEPTNALWIHPEVAAKLGVQDGRMVEVRNRRGKGSGPLPARVTQRVDIDVVYMTHGHGHQAPGLTRAHGWGGDDSAVIEDYAVDPISGSTGMRTEFVTVHAAGNRAEG
jgi:thiosulfate reductase/polysulfide reductase chain A